jgi:molybdenum-dependent DNA-binding transcriptional regulator ModE
MALRSIQAFGLSDARTHVQRCCPDFRMNSRNLNHLVTLAALAETGSFSGAARRLHLPASTVSEHVAALERNLGVQPVIRATRRNRLPEAGRIPAQGAA